ncbi:DUF1289 domain-containing protein [Simiduia aestuariiviva]|uniref:DUF1289 domain-containing protein n=1 Tax=Simiduia aestuariiviva TaxID=1510459 RepID=A0A839UJE9_9GAMM|nr:hypothetical protein [Simiduia aestuariiviva]
MSERRPVRVKSPCTSICALNDADVCVGCYRTADEISRWSRMLPEEQRIVVLAARERAKEDNPFA